MQGSWGMACEGHAWVQMVMHALSRWKWVYYGGGRHKNKPRTVSNGCGWAEKDNLGHMQIAPYRNRMRLKKKKQKAQNPHNKLLHNQSMTLKRARAKRNKARTTIRAKSVRLGKSKTRATKRQENHLTKCWRETSTSAKKHKQWCQYRKSSFIKIKKKMVSMNCKNCTCEK